MVTPDAVVTARSMLWSPLKSPTAIAVGWLICAVWSAPKEPLPMPGKIMTPL